MKRALTLFAALWLGALAAPRAVPAQSAAATLTRGVRAYDDLEFDEAAGLLRRALAVQGSDALAPADAARALIYLAATEVFRDRPDSARAVARRLVLAQPRFRPDELVFPPEILSLYGEARRATLAVAARAPADTAIHPGAEAFAVQLYASSFHDVAVTLVAEDGRVVRTIYGGPIGDSLDLRWNGLDSSGTALPSGRYAITVTSLSRARRAVRILRLPLELRQGHVDTLPHPAPPPWEAERRPVKPALRALAPGVLAGAAIMVLPSVVASGEDASALRFVVGGTVTVAGIVAFVSHRPGRSIPANVARNRTLRDAWQSEVVEVARRNAERSREVLEIRSGTPMVLSPEGP